jgi:hypothetical protein
LFKAIFWPNTLKECVSILNGCSSNNLGFGTLLNLSIHTNEEQKRIMHSESHSCLLNSPNDSIYRFAYMDHMMIRAITL